MSAEAQRRTTRARQSAAHTVHTVIDSWPETDRTLIQAVDDHTAMLEKTNASLSILATCANDTLSFFKKWVPIAIGAVGILWPAANKIIQALHITGLTPQ